MTRMNFSLKTETGLEHVGDIKKVEGVKIKKILEKNNKPSKIGDLDQTGWDCTELCTCLKVSSRSYMCVIVYPVSGEKEGTEMEKEERRRTLFSLFSPNYAYSILASNI